MKFEREYYCNSNISAYVDYTLKNYDDLADNLIKVCMADNDPLTSVLDYGCAIGTLVNALNDRHVRTVGTDLSYWAINYGRVKYALGKRELQHMNRQMLEWDGIQFGLFLDVLEHIDTDEIVEMFSIMCLQNIIVRVPVVANEGEDYVLDIHRIDKTHVQRRTKQWWESLFYTYGYQHKHTFDESSIYDTDGVLARWYERK